MANPIQIERAFVELINTLNSSLSYRQKWIQARDFFELISNDFSAYDTYCLQLIPHLPVIQDPLSVGGCDPEFFEEVLAFLNRIVDEIPELKNDKSFQKVRTTIECSLIFLYACLNQLDIGLQCVDGSYPKMDNINERTDTLSLLDHYQQYYQNKSNEHLLACLSKVKEWWKNANQNLQRTVYVPVVEEQSGFEAGGRLRALRSRVIGQREDKDFYESYYAVFGAEKGENNFKQHMANNVRDVVNQSYPRGGDAFFHVQFSYRFKLGVEVGRSSELALGLSAFSSISKSLVDRYSFQPTPDIALTGMLDDDGTIKSVDPQGIRPKLEAAFFSWISTLVVPGSQKEEFDRVLGELQKKYPSRSLTIIGIDRFDDVIYHRRITQKKVESRTSFYLKKAWQRKFSVTGLLTIVTLLAVIGAMWYGPIDKNPTTGVFKGENLYIKNAEGQIIDEIRVGKRSVNIANPQGYSGPNKTHVSFIDINGDEINEIFWAEKSMEGSGSAGYAMLKAKEVGVDTLLWRKRIRYELNFPYKEHIIPESFDVTKIQSGDFNEDGQIDVLMSAVHTPFFPGILSVIDAVTGKEKRHLVNPGYINDFEPIDIDQDGKDEIVFGGISNSFEASFLAAVEFDKITGLLPHSKEYTLDRYKASDVIEFVIIPPTIMGKSIKSIIRYNGLMKIHNLEAQNLIQVRVNDARRRMGKSSLFTQAYLQYFFDYNFQIKNIGTSDAYYALAHELYNDGILRKMPNKRYFKAYRDSLLYWDGEELSRKIKR